MYQIDVKVILRTFEPLFQKVLRTSQAQKIFAGPYIKKRVYSMDFEPISRLPLRRTRSIKVYFQWRCHDIFWNIQFVLTQPRFNTYLLFNSSPLMKCFFLSLQINNTV